MKLSILHNTLAVGKTSMGIGQVALNLAKAQCETGCSVRIWSQDHADAHKWAAATSGLSERQIVTFPKFGFARLGFSRAMLSAATKNSDHFDIVHQHGIWTACSMVSNVFRNRHKTPVVIAPHGSLQAWALTRSSLKKKIAMLAYERHNLTNAACLHATAEAEVADFRDFGLKNPIALITNGVSASAMSRSGDATRFIEQFNITRDRHILLFLSRVTPKKGIPIMLQAIDRLRSHFDKWMLVIAGTDEFNHQKEIIALVDQLKLKDMVRIVGPLYDQDKQDAFAAADVFVLPSYSEGAPMVVLDSLAAGVPVITTRGTPWENLITHQCGWWVDASIDGLAVALRDMLAMSPEQLKDMGKRGKELMFDQYLWTVQAKKTLALYTWLLDKRDKPDFVISD